MLKIKKIEHLGIAVTDLKHAAALYEELFGLKVFREETVASQKVRTGFIQVGETKIELLESTDPDGPIARYIEKRGEGFQHLALHVENIDDAIAHVRAKNVRTLTETWSHGAGGSKVIFLHPKDTGGVLIEFVESKK
jgi:methylmalonyl-CoA/ethylmalonyl-CoA epimerase